MPDKVRAFFSLAAERTDCRFHSCAGDRGRRQSCAEYIGLDYSVALDLHLYHYAVRDMISWAIPKGYKWLRSSGLNYDPKFHLRHVLDPTDLYVRHTSVIMNAVLEADPSP